MKSFLSVIINESETSFGGNQRWFCDDTLKKYGCGLISCTDILLCLNQKPEVISRESYLLFAQNLGENFLRVKKKLGINGLSMAFGMNRYFKKNNLPYKAKWGAFKKNILVYIEKMLKKGIPVCLSIGPNLYKKPCGVGFYGGVDDKNFLRKNVCDHYVTVTDLIENSDEKWFEISSWGKRFFIKADDFFNYKKLFFTGFSNILVIKKRK